MTKSNSQIYFLIILIGIILFTIYKFNEFNRTKIIQEISKISKSEPKKENNKELELKNKMPQKKEKIENKAYIFEEQNRLGENFIRDFYRYECKSMKRYGSNNSDPMYRIDGKKLII